MIITTIAVLVIYLWYLIWMLRGLLAAHDFQTHTNSDETITPFSVIIAAHNEELNIGKTIRALVTQDYPVDSYEIILAADRCVDATVEEAAKAAGDFPNFRIIEIEKVPAGLAPKKYVLQTAIDRAAHENLVLMDADTVAGPTYLKIFCRQFSAGFEVVINIPKFVFDRTALHCYLRPERLVTRAIAVAGAGHRNPFLAFGGSWAYRRSLLKMAGELTSMGKSLSGDDDLLVQKLRRHQVPISVNLDDRGWVTTAIPDSWKSFIIQRRRHHSAGKHYSLPVQAGYLFYHLSNLLLWILPVVWWPASGALFLKLTADFFLLRHIARFFNEKISALNFLVFEAGYLLQHLVIAPLSFVGKIRWK